MLRPRITPCLLVRNKGLVKTRNFREPRYVGDPINAVRIFNEKEVDELMVLDIDASAQAREPDYRMIEHLAAECRMPLCYGGGVKTVEQALRIFGLGVEKIALSSSALANPDFVTQLATRVGRQSVAVVLDVKAAGKGYEILTHNGTKRWGRSPIEMAREFEARGAGEIVLNSIDRDGMMQGYDLDLAGSVRAATELPMTVIGGAGSLADIGRLIERCGIVGAAAGSLFVFKGALRAVLISYPPRAEKDDLVRRALGAGQPAAGPPPPGDPSCPPPPKNSMA